MGENEPAPPPPTNSLCRADTTLEGDVVVRNQEQLDVLEGCATIDGALTIKPFEGADLRPLHALTSVSGLLAFYDFYDDETERSSAYGNRVAELYATGWLTSLQGLERLERAGGLMIVGLSAGDLSPLSNLRALTNGGYLMLHDCPNLRDLSGLDHLGGIYDLDISCENLESLAPLQLPIQMNSFFVSGSKLTELGSLQIWGVNYAVHIIGTALTTLDAFSKLTGVTDHFLIENNAMLQTLSGLDSLGNAGALLIRNNPRLERLPEFSSLLRLQSLQLQNNPKLTNFPSFPARAPEVPPDDREVWEITTNALEVTDNASLRGIVMPYGWRDGKGVEIENNASLRELDLGQLESADRVAINDNPVLDSIRLDALARVDSLQVTGNPHLATSVFDSVQTFERNMAGNASTTP
jgi:hypothetical protein